MGPRLRGERGGERCHDCLGLVGELPRRDPYDPPSGPDQALISAPVLLERTAHRVEGPAVDLDDEVALAPDEVDLVALDPDVLVSGRGSWARRIRSSTRISASERVSLGLVVDEVLQGCVFLGGGGNGWNCSLRECGLMRRCRPASLTARSRFGGGRGGGDVEEGPGGGGDGDAVAAGDVVGVQGGAVDPDAGSAASVAADDRDVDRTLGGRAEVPEHGGWVVGDERARAGGERSRPSRGMSAPRAGRRGRRRDGAAAASRARPGG